MCGVAGYIGLGYLTADQRWDLVEALGLGIDSRGGDATGWAAVVGARVRMGRKLGGWCSARGRFIRAAAAGPTLMMHARWATMGAKELVTNAHPFPIYRRGRGIVLWGMHNGMLEGTQASARANGREHTVDSRELFELLADRQIGAIRALDGYGVITYLRPDGVVRVCRINRQSDFELAEVEGGGLVYASTSSILTNALKYVRLPVVSKPSVNVVGQVYKLLPRGRVMKDKLSGVSVDTMWSRWNDRGWDDDYSSPYTIPEYRRSELDPKSWVRVEENDEPWYEPKSQSGESNGRISTPSDFDAEQAKEWERFWKENSHLIGS